MKLKNSKPQGVAQRKHLPGLSVSDLDIRHCNVISFEHSESAEKLLKLGKELGLSVRGDNSQVVENLVQLEDRDRLAKSAKGFDRVIS